MSNKKNDKTVDETEALDTLAAGSKPADLPRTKTEALSDMFSMAQITPTDELVTLVSKWKSEWESNRKSITDQSAENRNTIKTTSEAVSEAIREDAAAMFAETDLTDEGKEKAVLLFEAAVNARLAILGEELEAAMEERLNESLEQITEELATRLDDFLTVEADRWMEENQVAVETALKVDEATKVVEGIRNLFSELSIDLPESDISKVEEQAEMIKELNKKVSELTSDLASLKKADEENVKEALIDMVGEGLALSEVDKLKQLCETFAYTGDDDAFVRKVEIVKEAHFKTSEKGSSKTINESTTLVGLGDTIEGEGDILTENFDKTSAKKRIDESALSPDVRGVLASFNREKRILNRR